MRSDRWKSIVAAAGLLIGLLGLWSSSSPGQAPEANPRPTPWEYESFIGGNNPQNEELNRFGASGWELVAVSDQPNSVLYVFKRPKRR